MVAKDLEKLIGHLSFLGLLRREALSFCVNVYVVTNKQRGLVPGPLWKSVQDERRLFQCILPLLFLDLRASWADRVTCIDASPSGYGVVECDLNIQRVAAAGRVNERWAFSKAAEPNLRLNYLDMADSIEELNFLSNVIISSAKLHTRSLLPVLVGANWRIVGSGQWVDSPHIVLGEGRAIVWALKHLLRKVGNFGKRFLLVSGSLVNVMALLKGRSSKDVVRPSARCIAGLLFASGAHLYYRLLPSE